MQNKFTKREFIKLLGMGSLGLIFWQCYDSKKENNPIGLNSNNPEKKHSDEIDFTDEDVIFIERNDEKYHALRKGFNKRFDKFPKTIALCFTTQGVQAAVLKEIGRAH